MRKLLEKFQRLNDFYNIGPVQRAELEDFVEELAKSKIVSVTLDGVTVQEKDVVWVLSSVGIPEKTTVKPLRAETNYTLFGKIPVSESFSTKESASMFVATPKYERDDGPLTTKQLEQLIGTK